MLPCKTRGDGSSQPCRLASLSSELCASNPSFARAPPPHHLCKARTTIDRRASAHHHHSRPCTRTKLTSNHQQHHIVQFRHDTQPSLSLSPTRSLHRRHRHRPDQTGLSPTNHQLNRNDSHTRLGHSSVAANTNPAAEQNISRRGVRQGHKRTNATHKNNTTLRLHWTSPLHLRFLDNANKGLQLQQSKPQAFMIMGKRVLR